MLKIKLNDGAEIVITDFNANTNVNNNAGSMNFNTSFSNRNLVYAKVTPENTSEITLITPESDNVYSGFNNNITITENVNEFNQNISISASKQGG